MLNGIIVVVCSEINTKYVRQCGENVQFLIFKPVAALYNQ
jgi:hypothetical protein